MAKPYAYGKISTQEAVTYLESGWVLVLARQKGYHDNYQLECKESKFIKPVSSGVSYNLITMGYKFEEKQKGE